MPSNQTGIRILSINRKVVPLCLTLNLTLFHCMNENTLRHALKAAPSIGHPIKLLTGGRRSNNV